MVPAPSDAYPAVSFPLLSSQKPSYELVDPNQRPEGSGAIPRGSGTIPTSKSSWRAYQVVKNSDGQPATVNDMGTPGWTEELGVLLSTGEPGYNRALVGDGRLNAPDVPTTAFPQSASSFNWN
ncbi:hypothetical protein FRC04_003436 [Tulasnella sp. 424]|nr:hypothetical protein FRC04_003436 [Tulasnella sp. 424]